jgi:hypothetical protein
MEAAEDKKRKGSNEDDKSQEKSCKQSKYSDLLQIVIVLMCRMLKCLHMMGN